MVPTLVVILALAVLYWFPIRRWMNGWGAAPSDVARVMAGDGLLRDWTYSGTMAIVVNAPEQDLAMARADRLQAWRPLQL